VFPQCWTGVSARTSLPFNLKQARLQLTDILSAEWADKKVVVFSVPGAFTPSCSAKHLPGFIEKLPELKSKNVDIIACIAFNDAFVMSAWGKANGIKNDDIVCDMLCFLLRHHSLSVEMIGACDFTQQELCPV
jgi:peroxiredoxin